MGSGCVKITPAHDPNDYAVWERHKDRVQTINLLLADGRYNDNAGAYAGLDRFEVRERVVKDLEAQGLLVQVEERETEIGHSDRSKTPIEPFLSKQWFVRMDDVPGGVTFGRGLAKEFTAPGLAQAAIDAAGGTWRSATGLQLDFHPDGERYRRGYTSWLAEKRDWCISRQLWWGHQIPVWWRRFEDRAELAKVAAQLTHSERAWIWISDDDGAQHPRDVDLSTLPEGPLELQVCLRAEADDAVLAPGLEALGLVRDADVLDTWFSSALWPFSTLGWPDPDAAPIETGQRFLGAQGGHPSSLDTYYPGSCLVTARDILTLWVARMVIMGLYTQGDLPFTDVFLHAKILDGKGVTMSKSKGNGIDPVDVINEYGTDAMRYLICHMQTGTQDIRLPVQATCPHCEAVVELADAKHGRTADGHVNLFTYACTNKQCKREFDVGGKTEDLPTAKVTSDRFLPGRNFCTKVWNATRFALMNLGEFGFQSLEFAGLAPEDRWILSRLSAAVSEVHQQLEAYNPSMAQGAARAFFWNDLCDWYLELIKPRMKDGDPAAAQVLVTCLDQALRLLHPFMPFITEALWAKLRQVAPQRGIAEPLPDSALLIQAAWPQGLEAWRDEALEADVVRMQELVTALRSLRKDHGVPPGKALEARIKAPAELAPSLSRMADTIKLSANLSSLDVGPAVEPPANAATAVIGECEAFLGDVLDPEKERERLGKLQQDLEKRLTGSRKKLENQGFVAKAPPAVVEAERAKVAELEGQLLSVRESLAALG
ncbi:MAG: class I tRNA ligase family protein [Planctomycetota bacterium]